MLFMQAHQDLQREKEQIEVLIWGYLAIIEPFVVRN